MGKRGPDYSGKQGAFKTFLRRTISSDLAAPNRFGFGIGSIRLEWHDEVTEALR